MVTDGSTDQAGIAHIPIERAIDILVNRAARLPAAGRQDNSQIAAGRQAAFRAETKRRPESRQDQKP